MSAHTAAATAISNVSASGVAETRAPREAVPAVKTRLRLTRRGRFVFTALGAAPLVVAAFLFAVNGGTAVATAERPDVSFEYLTVHAGESLWSLAEEIAPSADPRDIVDEIVSLNQLDTATIEPGQRIAIPAQYAD